MPESASPASSSATRCCATFPNRANGSVVLPQRRLVRPFRRLVIGERLRGVDVAEAGVTRGEGFGLVDSEASRKYGRDAGDLHLAEAGERFEAAAQVGRVRGFAPDAGGIAAVFVGAALFIVGCAQSGSSSASSESSASSTTSKYWWASSRALRKWW